jgi:hypothetical protein
LIGLSTYSNVSNVQAAPVEIWEPPKGENMTEKQKNVIRQRRQDECFVVINRGTLWYNCLTIEQKAELNGWYHKWLNATETGVIPPKPSWLNDKIEKEEILL